MPLRGVYGRVPRDFLLFAREYGEQKTDKEKSHKGIWWWECPGSVPGMNSGRPRNTRDVWADLCGNSRSRGRMSAGRTGQMTGQMGHVHGTDGTQTRGCPAKILCVYWFFFPHRKRAESAFSLGQQPGIPGPRSSGVAYTPKGSYDNTRFIRSLSAPHHCHNPEG